MGVTFKDYQGVIHMKKTGKILLSALLIASISLTTVLLTAPVTSPRMVTPVSAAENSIQWHYDQ